MLRESGSLFSAEGAGGAWITAHCDGGSRGNPGPAGFGVYIEGPDGQKLAELSEFLGRTTNNVAEYSALLAALDFALRNGHPRLRVVADSELMVKQIQGRYKVNSPDLRPLYDEAKRRVARLDGFRIEHVLRGKNQRADRLANLAMDRGTGRSGGTSRPSSRSEGAEQESEPRPKEPPKTAKGYVKGGVVHLIEGELPEGAFVRVLLDRQ
jgi:ribonuclease HI